MILMNVFKVQIGSDTILLEYKQYTPVGISAKYKYLNQQHSVGKVVLMQIQQIHHF
jgi:hypothetical protein